MGNRAVLQFKDGTGIYLHWNGGLESVLSFLDTAKHFGVRTNEDYGVARLVQIIGNCFGGTLSLGVGRAVQMDRDNMDNGTYHIGLDFSIVRREFTNDFRRTVGELSPKELERYAALKQEAILRNEDFFLEDKTR